MAEIIYRLPGREPYSYTEVKVDTSELEGPEGDSYLLELLTNALAALNQVYQDSPASSASGSQNARPAAPAVFNGAQTTCVHGARARKTGNSARGAWVGWFCPEKDKANQCGAEWEKN